MHASWNAYFSNLDSGVAPTVAFTAPPSLGGSAQASISAPAVQPAGSAAPVSDSLGVSYLIKAFQVRGHEVANLDPLGIHSFRDFNSAPKELDYKYHGFKDSDLDRRMNLLGTSSGGNVGFLDILGSRPNITLRQILQNLEKTYCSTIGVEYMHMASAEKLNWIRDQVETPKWMQFSKEKKLHIYERLCFADQFEKFLAHKFNTAKRFGLEGGENCIPGLKALVDRGSELGCENFVLGMAHRGRLNVLANVLRKPMPQIFKEFQGTHYDLDEYMSNDWSSAGDVKYHLGTSMDRSYPDGRRVHISLVANPSHLEACDPVVIGKIRAKQVISGNRPEDLNKFMPILIHGDAAFAGQGVVYETMQMSRVPDYAVGGTVHVVINNQVGFTCDPKNGRSTMYCSDLGKAFNIPIFHVNGDDPLAVCTAFELAADWRQRFNEDCIIDMICYRKYGHNELDQPMYTQPLLYSKINQHPDPINMYENKLVSDGSCTTEELKAIKNSVSKILDDEFEAAKSWETPPYDWLSSRWKGFLSPLQKSRVRSTGLKLEKLKELGTKLCTIPSSFHIHRQLEKVFQQRKDTIENSRGIDWGTAEALAFGSLLQEGIHVRLSGQDVQRGTFSHRHAVLVDQQSGELYSPFNHLAKHVSASAPASRTIAPDIQALFTCRNSILSEFGVLGFEVGYSLENPNTLTLWEAQFGDFANGAQIMFDQFISSGEDKWLRQSALTMLLPHGYMGQGAEHSSCRIERFLQQVDEDPDVVPSDDELSRQIQLTNWQVVNCSTPANYYHVLRRQIHRDFRKPLIVATPKSLLRDRRCVSTLEDMGEGTHFETVIPETDATISENADGIRKVVFCTGKVYYDILEEREKRNLKDVAVVRVEQLAPFPWKEVANECALYKNASIVWAQEEPKNMGSWGYIEPRMRTVTRDLEKSGRPPVYAGRRPAAAVATGLGARAHNAEQAELINNALN